MSGVLHPSESKTKRKSKKKKKKATTKLPSCKTTSCNQKKETKKKMQQLQNVLRIEIQKVKLFHDEAQSYFLHTIPLSEVGIVHE
ncbi:MAG TPA: hypothetical protein DDY18_00615 [Flavobacterium sp.]|nr:hypothetical protein [Flavobacterium sp.]